MAGLTVRRWLPFLAAGLVAGALSGLFGIGGGLVLVPMMVFFFHFRQKVAQATSLGAIILTAIAAAIPYALQTSVNWLAAGLIVVGGVGGSFAGAAIVKRVKDHWLQILFAVVAMVSAVKMLITTPPTAGHTGLSPTASVWAGLAYVGAGLAMGLLSALVGIGGGIILVPLLALLLGLPQTSAQGLSLIVMAPISAVGAIRHAGSGYTNWRAALALGIGGAIMSPLSAQLALHLPTTILPKLFAVLLIFTAGQLAYRAIKTMRSSRDKAA